MPDQPFKQVLEQIESERVPAGVDLWPAIGRQAAGVTRRRQLARRVGRLAFAGLLLAGLLLGAFALDTLPFGQRPAAASAAPLLNQLAGVAAAQAPAPASGYRYQKSDEAYLSIAANPAGETFAILLPKIREIWIGPDGSGRIRETHGQSVYLAPADQARRAAAGFGEPPEPLNADFGPGGLTYQDFGQYPTDPATLALLLRRQANFPGGPPVDPETFVVVADLLRQPGVPPDLRAALFRVAAQIPGVELVGPQADRSGRPGIAVAMTSDYSGAKLRHLLIIDPATSELLGEEQVLLEKVEWTAAQPPVIIAYATYLEGAVVAKLP